MSNSEKNATLEFAKRMAKLGFRVWVSKPKGRFYGGNYGFLTDTNGNRVLCFEFSRSDGYLRGCYGPPSSESGTGWRLDQKPWDLITAEDVIKALNETPPKYCGKGWGYLHTLKSYTEAMPPFGEITWWWAPPMSAAVEAYEEITEAIR